MSAIDGALRPILAWWHAHGALMTAIGLLAVIGLIAFLVVLQRREWREFQQDRIRRNRRKRAPRIDPTSGKDP